MKEMKSTKSISSIAAKLVNMKSHATISPPPPATTTAQSPYKTISTSPAMI